MVIGAGGFGGSEPSATSQASDDRECSRNGNNHHPRLRRLGGLSAHRSCEGRVVMTPDPTREEARTLSGAEALLRRYAQDGRFCNACGADVGDGEKPHHEGCAIDAFLALPSPDASAGGEWECHIKDRAGYATEVWYRNGKEVSRGAVEDALNARPAPAQAVLREAAQEALDWFIENHTYTSSDPQDAGYYAPCEPPGADCEACNGLLHVLTAALADEQAKGEANDATR